MTTPWVAFREQLLDALDRANPQRRGDPFDRYWRLTPDHWIHACPACKSELPHYLAVELHGETPAATLRCTRGCTDTLIRHALERATPRRPHHDFVARWGHAA